MNVSDRIKAIVNEIQFDTMADIGTDHGYIPIYGVMSGKVKRAIACDLNHEPLKRADENVRNYNLGKFIQTRQGSGFSPLGVGEVDTVVVAGLGGMLINGMLNENLEIVSKLKQLIVSPHLNVCEVRKEIHKIGFKINNEIMVKELGKFYHIISSTPGVDQEYSENDYILGKILAETRPVVYLEFVKANITEIEKVRGKIQVYESSNENIFTKLQNLDHLHNIYRAVLENEM